MAFTIESTRDFFSRPAIVEEYVQAAHAVGLWTSEEKLFTRLFKQEDTLLELGCGAGRIAFGLWELGYRNLMATDIARPMVKEARRINKLLGAGVCTQVADATRLPFADAEYDGAIFGFNGLMQIPGRENRKKALGEIHRVLTPGAWFVFTAHDRSNPKRRKHWQQERQKWNAGEQDADLLEFGDITYNTDDGGKLYIHAPLSEDVREDCKEAGFRVEADVLRSQLAQEKEETLAFSDDCRFWIVQKPV